MAAAPPISLKDGRRIQAVVLEADSLQISAIYSPGGVGGHCSSDCPGFARHSQLMPYASNPFVQPHS